MIMRLAAAKQIDQVARKRVELGRLAARWKPMRDVFGEQPMHGGQQYLRVDRLAKETVVAYKRRRAWLPRNEYEDDIGEPRKRAQTVTEFAA